MANRCPIVIVQAPSSRVPALDLVVVIKYEAENPRDPEAGTSHDDMHLFELVVQAVR